MAPVVLKSVPEFIARVTEDTVTSRDHLHSNLSSATLYRGQANSSWRLYPSLYRVDLFNQERTLILELLRIRPEEFDGLTKFDILVKMQHYGLPTRLLDMTHNPLVALYFACDSVVSGKEDGSVYAFRGMPVLWQDNYAVRLLMTYIFEFAGPRLDLERFLYAVLKDPLLSTVWNDETKLRDVAVHYLTKVPVTAVRPSLANLRIAQQDGAFLIFGMSVKQELVSTNPGTKGRVYLELAPYPSDETGERLWHQVTEYRIPADRKLGIRRALEALGIRRSRLFPELQYQAEFVRELVAMEAESQGKAFQDDDLRD